MISFVIQKEFNIVKYNYLYSFRKEKNCLIFVLSLKTDIHKKLRILLKLKNQINNDGVLQLTVSKNRTQFQNKISDRKNFGMCKSSHYCTEAKKGNPTNEIFYRKKNSTKKQHSEKKKIGKFSF